MLGNLNSISDQNSFASSSLNQNGDPKNFVNLNRNKQTNLKTKDNPLWRCGNLINDSFPKTSTKTVFKAKNGPSLTLKRITQHLEIHAILRNYLEFNQNI